MGVRESIKVTTVKPSGTVSLLFGVTPGCHWPRESGYYVRTIRESVSNPIVQVMRDAGYPVEPSQMNPDTTVVVTLPVEGPEMRSERDVSMWEKTHLAQMCQRYWSDNSVSVTVTFNEAEADDIPAVLAAFDGQLKSLSFLTMAEGVYAQAPYQRVSREEWEALRAQVQPIDWGKLYSPDAGLNAAEGELYCTTDVCEIKK
jgi:ribonucleoside-triphosphate reductase (thioredoxin)